jgi:hypothetical protein
MVLVTAISAIRHLHDLDVAFQPSSSMSTPCLLTPHAYSSSTCGYCTPSGSRSERSSSKKYGREFIGLMSMIKVDEKSRLVRCLFRYFLPITSHRRS